MVPGPSGSLLLLELVAVYQDVGASGKSLNRRVEGSEMPSIAAVSLLLLLRRQDIVAVGEGEAATAAVVTA